jgi:hypothetical protein
MVTKYLQYPKIIPNGHKINQHFPTYGPPKFTQSGIFDLEKTIWQPWARIPSSIFVVYVKPFDGHRPRKIFLGVWNHARRPSYLTFLFALGLA